MGLKGVLLTVTTIALMAVALITLPLTLAVLGVIALMVIYILADALGYRVLFKMALRNFTRRPATTAMVLAGLMVGTAIISASLVVGDTFDNMVVGRPPRPSAASISWSPAPATLGRGVLSFQRIIREDGCARPRGGGEGGMGPGDNDQHQVPGIGPHQPRVACWA